MALLRHSAIGLAMFMFFYFNHLHARMAAWLSVLLACQYFLKPVISQSFSKIALPVRLSCNTKRPPQGGPGHHFLGLPASERFSRTLPLLLRSRGCVPPPGLGTTTSGLSGLLSAMFSSPKNGKSAIDGDTPRVFALQRGSDYKLRSIKFILVSAQAFEPVIWLRSCRPESRTLNEAEWILATVTDFFLRTE